MSEYNSGLPIRTQADGADERVHVKIYGNPTGSGPATNEAIVDDDKNLHIESHGNDPVGLDVEQVLTEEGRTTSRGDYDVATNTKPSSNAVILHSRQAAPDETHQTFRPTGVASSDGSNAKALDVAIRDEDGNKFTSSNPFPVTVVDSEGNEINDYEQDTAVAANATASHDYTVTALKTLKLSKIEASSSGRALFRLQVETGVATNVFTTKFVKRGTTAIPNVEFDVKELITVSAGVRVRVEYVNTDNQAMDFNSTISGHEI